MTTVPETHTPVPFLDLAAAHAPLRSLLLEEIGKIIDSSAFVNGAPVRAFEEEFAAYCGVDHCVGLASGLDGLRLGLAAAGVGPGDEVIVPAMTFVATWEAVSQVGATPVPVEVSAADYCLDPEAFAAAVTKRTAAVMPVHLYGQLADMAAIAPIAAKHDLLLVEDAAQAHGAERGSARAGSTGRVSAFSFYPGKNFGALGDAGALVTPDAVLADQARALREHGQRRKYHHDVVGWTARLDTIQAAALSVKLPLLDGWNAARRSVAAAYGAQLEGVGDLVLPPVAPASDPVWHLYVIRTADPVGLAEFLATRGIASGRHYPVPPHRTGAYESLGYAAGAFPVAERIAAECLSLPMFPTLTEAQVARACDAIREWFARP